MSPEFPSRSDTNWAVQPQKMVRGLKFNIKEEEGLYYLCSKIKGTDQLRGYCTADLHLYFRICKKNGFLTTQLNVYLVVFVEIPETFSSHIPPTAAGCRVGSVVW